MQSSHTEMNRRLFGGAEKVFSMRLHWRICTKTYLYITGIELCSLLPSITMGVEGNDTDDDDR